MPKKQIVIDVEYQEMQEVEFKKMVREIANMAFDKYNHKEIKDYDVKVVGTHGL